MRVCNVSLCSTLTQHPSGKCEAHYRADRKRSDAKRPNARERGYDRHWEATREAYLAAFRRCEEPGCQEPATQADHIQAKRDGGSDDWSNLRSYCHSHHSQRTARDQPGGWRVRATNQP